MPSKSQIARWSVLLSCVWACCACDEDAEAPPPFDATADYSTQLRSLAELTAFSAAQAVAGVKYLAPIAGAQPLLPLTADCYFQNMQHYPWHLQFLQSFPELASANLDSYRNWVLRKATRRLWGGTVQSWPRVEHPTQHAPGVISYSIYADPGGLSVADVASVHERLQRCLPFATKQLAFLPEAPDQLALVERASADFERRGVATVLPSALSDRLEHVAYSEGEGYGYLQVVPSGQALVDYGPRTIPVVENAPNDISIVAGLLTRYPQNELGHVNLRLHEKGIPNAALPDVYDTAWLLALDTQLVHLTVSEDSISVVAAELSEAETFWQAHRPQVRAPHADLTVHELSALHDLRAADASAFGAKCANLGELSQVLSDTHRPDGFSSPFSQYREFSQEPELDAAISALLADPAVRSDARYKRTALKKLRDRIRATPLSASLTSELQRAVDAAFGTAGYTKYLRVRSSTNVEDLDEFTGAGLYDSRSGCLTDDLDADETGPSACLSADKRAALEQQLALREEELAQHPDRDYVREIIADIRGDLSGEKPLADAVRKVFASLWNERAFDEREYYGIAHRDAYMGLCVHPSFELEQINAVAVSNLHVDQGAALYRLNSQLGELSVVTPEDPSAVAELLTFRRDHTPAEATEITLQTRSSLATESEQIWPPDKLQELAQLLFQVHDHFEREVYTNNAALALDFEVKLERSGAVTIKQVRPYHRAAGEP